MKGLDVKKKLQDSGFSLKEIAEVMGETPQNLNSMLNAQDIKTGVVERIAKAIKKNLYFFYDEEKIKIHEKEGKNMIPFFDDVTTIGGVNSISASVDGCMPASEWIDAGDWFHEANAAIRHYGDSMVEYPSGCILVLKKVEDLRLIMWGRNYCIETSEFRITKRLQSGENDTIVAYSSNTDTYPDGRQVHEPKVIPMDTIKSIWLVLGCVVKEFSSGAVFIKK